MNINLDVILGTINEWFICLFKNSKHAKDSPPHFHIIIPVKEENNKIGKTEKSFISSHSYLGDPVRKGGDERYPPCFKMFYLLKFVIFNRSAYFLSR